jgi:hypothetical protein
MEEQSGGGLRREVRTTLDPMMGTVMITVGAVLKMFIGHMQQVILPWKE